MFKYSNSSLSTIQGSSKSNEITIQLTDDINNFIMSKKEVLKEPLIYNLTQQSFYPKYIANSLGKVLGPNKVYLAFPIIKEE
jgi:hypothetical protein